VLDSHLALPLVAYGKGGVAEQGHYSAPWDHTQDYSGWGPACYYGQDVHVVYEATNTWTWVLYKNGDVPPRHPSLPRNRTVL